MATVSNDPGGTVGGYDSTTTGSTDASGGTGTGDIGNFDVSGLGFKFNPPLHKDARFILADLGESSKRDARNYTTSFYNDVRNSYSEESDDRDGNKATYFEGLRLGRIIMDDMAISKGTIEEGIRHGFRFLYNPTELSGSLNVGTDFIPDQRSTNTAVLQQGIENMQLEILLNRIPDVTSNAKESDYLPQITAEDLKRLKKQGTHYDVDHLYRVANGIHDTLGTTRTGDIGVLLPNPCRLILGPYTSRGAIVSVSVSDQMFSGHMVPILSYVNITFARFLNMAPQDMTKLESYGISQGGSSGDDDSSDGGGGGGGGDGGGGTDDGGPLPPGKNPNYPINFSGVKGTSEYGHKIHSAVTTAFSWMDRRGAFGDYAAGDSNHGTGRALDLMQSSVNPKNSSHKGWEVARFLKSHASTLYVTQLIFQKHIWTKERGREGWRSMGDRGNDTDNHFDHVHVSFGPGSGNEDRSKRLTLTNSQQYWS